MINKKGKLKKTKTKNQQGKCKLLKTGLTLHPRMVENTISKLRDKIKEIVFAVK